MAYIYRTYEIGKVNVSLTLNNIHKFLFETANSVSSKTEDDAKLLTAFFQALKNLSKNSVEDGNKSIAVEILEDEIKTLSPEIYSQLSNLDFTKGGRGRGGVAFEKEIWKIFETVFSEADGEDMISGQTKSAVYINLGEKEKDVNLSNLIIDDVINIAEGKLRTIKRRVEEPENMLVPPNLPLQITKKVDGKIDLKAGSGTKWNIAIGINSTFLNAALELLRTSSFSIKSYKTDRLVSLGSTKKTNAVSAVAEYVAEKSGNPYTRYAATFYNAHPNRQDKKFRAKSEDTSAALDEIYKHYAHMRNVYELTGIGLRPDEINELYNVDFLLINRASQNNINVYSTQSLLNKIKNKDKYRTHWDFDKE